MLVDIKDKWFLVRNHPDWDHEIIIAKYEKVKKEKGTTMLYVSNCIGSVWSEFELRSDWEGSAVKFIVMEYKQVLDFMVKHKIPRPLFEKLLGM